MKIEIDKELDKQLDGIGKAVNNVNKDIFTEQMQLLNDTVRNVMEDKKVTASYNLVQSIEVRQINEKEQGIFMDYYWKFVNYGVKGTRGGQSDMNYSYKKLRPSPKHFKNWDYFKRININPYAMSWHIFTEGIKKRNFIEEAINKFIKL